MPVVPDTRKEAEIRFRVLKTIEAHQDKCPTSTIREGALHGNDSAFERLLGQSGILRRTEMVLVTTVGDVDYYGRTERGKNMQEWLLWAISIDKHTGGEGWTR